MRQLFAASMIGRLPIGITGLAILILVQSTTGSFARGGAATGCYVAGLAASRTGTRPLDRSLRSATRPDGLLACCFRRRSARSWPAYRAQVAAVASPAARRSRRRHLPADHRLHAHFPQAPAGGRRDALDRVLARIGPDRDDLHRRTDAGRAARRGSVACRRRCWPQLAAVCTAHSSFCARPRCALGASGHATDAACSARSPSRGFVPLIGVILCYSIAFGLLEIGMTAYATEAGNPALAGVLLGLMSAGSALGGLAYGSRSWHSPLVAAVRADARSDGRGPRHARSAVEPLVVCGLVRSSRGSSWRPH